jgi:polyhydroxyalkanoate synthesis regulator protein
MVPGYLQFSLENLAKEQEKLRTQFASVFANPAAAFEVYQDLARRNMAMFEQALSMWTPFGGRGADGAQEGQQGAENGEPRKDSDEINDLKSQLANMQQKIDKLSENRDN